MKNLKGPNWFIKQPNKEKLDEIFKNSFYHVADEKECNICGVKFKHGRSNCLSCNAHEIYTFCSICDKKFLINFDRFSGTQINKILEAIKNNEKFEICCSINCRQKLIYENQRKNKTGWCSKEAIMKRNSTENNSIRQQNANRRGLKAKAVETQIARGLHPNQLRLKSKIIEALKSKNINIDKSIHYNSLMDLYLNNFPLVINGKLEKDCNIYNNRCGAIGLTGVSIKDGVRYALNAGKSIDIGSEIRKFQKIIERSFIQDPNYDYGRWYHIANDYKDFEIIIICCDVTEQEALLMEAAWAYQNNANFKYSIDENGNKIQIKNTHGYWM